MLGGGYGCVDHRTISGSPSSLFTKWFPEIKFRLSSNKCPYPSGQPGILALKHLPSKHAPLVCSCKRESPTSVELPGCRHGLKHFSLWNLQNTCQPLAPILCYPCPRERAVQSQRPSHLSGRVGLGTWAPPAVVTGFLSCCMTCSPCLKSQSATAGQFLKIYRDQDLTVQKNGQC